jgi:hypothetical protein
MQPDALLLRRLPAAIADEPAAWANSPASGFSDRRLAAAVAAAIERPKRTADSSFLTHAPLELAARLALLPMVAPAAREAVRRRIAAIAARYANEGEEADAAPADFPGTDEAAAALLGALQEGDPATVDQALLYLIPRLSVAALRRAVADAVIPALGAAAHAPILLAELPRLEARLAGATRLLRAPLTMIAKEPLKIAWPQRAAADPDPDGEAALAERLAAPPRVACGSVYIAPIMQAVERDHYAEDRLAAPTAGLSLAAAARAILRAGARSMIEDDEKEAPYGWSHALTMPQGVLLAAEAAADQRAAIRVAATHALGFRAVFGRVALSDAPPPRPRRAALFDVAPIEAAGAAFYAAPAALPEILTALATRAAAHKDAHLAKYTLAAFDAAARDPDAAPLFIAAAAYLGAWWDLHPDAGFEG